VVEDGIGIAGDEEGAAGRAAEAERYPDGWKDFIMMAVLASEYGSAARTVPASMPGQAWQSHKGTDNQ